MIVRAAPPLHLTYCLNIHPGESWEEVVEAIRTWTLPIRETIAPGRAFGLGLRLSRRAADALEAPEALKPFRALLADHGLYVFTINGFPYGTFHGKPVKTDVYRPDWSTPERLAYTVQLARLLARLLTDDAAEGSISTLPLGYRSQSREIPAPVFAEALAECAFALDAIHRRTGRLVHVDLEPEPDCLLETTRDVIAFFEGPLRSAGVSRLRSRLGITRDAAEALLRRHIGVCVDTCHLAIQFETLADSMSELTRHGIRIGKVQLSSALEADSRAARDRLREFVDPIYLHQVRERPEPGQVPGSYPDLSDALAADSPPAVWRIHFHLPLYYTGDSVLRTTTPAMDDAFWKTLRHTPVAHCEVETYTFHVLPESLRAGGVCGCIARELQWAIKHLGA